ncbi:ABC transporter ATP-binding protein [Ginsengibacter hankyongi]|uniref:ABC transporter ATP-binding protein n=1 Tax=Ginsengibacter hankyongi TaxID=2607284 RepID=A0A5J5IJ94_9BACT|nr:ABC transporter ATP-binding protein [Ginsengibacter hankyongi]KAA9039362.1 ABC transporter ATP-binding protein [Ginsengibacter hankyongi]
MKTIIEVANLTKKFKDITAVSGLSFTVNEGDVYGFLGQNGAGKSTTIRMLLTLIRPTSGSISIFNKDLVTHREEILRQTGAIIEKPDLYNFLTANENVAFLSKLSGKSVSRKEVLEILKMVGLSERATSKVKTFSQGMKQRLGIAVALIHDPSLIILDEPTNGLDPQGIADTRELIKNLSCQHGKTVVVSSHLLSEIELIANRLLIIHNGKKIVEGTTKELLDPSKTIVEIDTTDNIAAREILLQSEFNTAVKKLKEEKIILQMDRNIIPSLINFLVKNNIGILSAETRHSLEDYFLSITNPGTNVEPATI